MKVFHLSTVFLLLSLSVNGQNPILGQWKTIDDETGRQRSIVELYMLGDELHGKVVQLFRSPGEDPDPICEDCKDDRKNQKVIGMEILRDMQKDGNEWKDGTICDPENGKVYDCKIWLEDGKLMVRGYVAFFYRTQTWLPISP